MIAKPSSIDAAPPAKRATTRPTKGSGSSDHDPNMNSEVSTQRIDDLTEDVIAGQDDLLRSYREINNRLDPFEVGLHERLSDTPVIPEPSPISLGWTHPRSLRSQRTASTSPILSSLFPSKIVLKPKRISRFRIHFYSTLAMTRPQTQTSKISHMKKCFKILLYTRRSSHFMIQFVLSTT